MKTLAPGCIGFSGRLGQLVVRRPARGPNLVKVEPCPLTTAKRSCRPCNPRNFEDRIIQGRHAEGEEAAARGTSAEATARFARLEHMETRPPYPHSLPEGDGTIPV